MASKSNFFVFDHRMKPLVQLDATPSPRTWVLNDVGPCRFEVGTTESKTTEINLQYGNLVRIEHIPGYENGQTKGKLPDWYGIILPRRVWNKSAMVGAAFSAESILTLRNMPWRRVEGTPKVIFLKILEYAAQVDSSIVIQPGIVEDVNQTLTDDLRGSAYDHIVQLIKKCGMSWSVTGAVNQDGSLALYANLVVQSGVDTGVTLNNLNSELHSPILVEDGVPHNVVNGFSFAPTQRARFERQAIHAGALADYGYMGINKTFTGLHDPSSTLFAAQIEANTYGRPIKLMGRNALNVGKMYDSLRLGNLLHEENHDVGFLPGGGIGLQAPLRILKMTCDEFEDKIEMMTEVL